MKALLILFIGVFAAALSVVFVRESSEAPIMLAAWRVLIAGVVLSPLYWRDRQRHGDVSWAGVWCRSWLAGLLLGVHFVTWVVGARLTPAANANLIVNMLPVVMPFLLYAMFTERIQRREIIATAIVISGLFLLGASDFQTNPAYFYGDMVCLASMLLMALYLALARRHRKVASVWLYIVPVYLVAGVSTIAVAVFFSSPIRPRTTFDISMILSLALISTVIGHSALNYAMQHLRGQTVSVVSMAQFVIGGVAGFYLYGEVPKTGFYAASALFLLAMWLVLSPAASRLDKH